MPFVETMDHSTQVPFSTATIYDLVRDSAITHPDAGAILAPERLPLSYRQLLDLVDDAALSLQRMGLKRGDRVAIVLPNGPEMAAAFLAVAACATCAPLNPGYKAEEFDFYLSDLNAKALLIQAGLDTSAISAAAARGIPIVTLTPQTDVEAGVFTLHGEESMRPVSGEKTESEDIALVLHTSGTTARPKIVPLTQANLCASARHISTTLTLGESDRCLNIMPLFHIHGLVAAVLSSLCAGAGVVCTPGFYAPQFFSWMDEARPTWYTAVPTMHQSILTRAAANAEVIARNPLRFIRSSSSALPPQVMAELEQVFMAPVIEAYGMTEASHQMTSNPLPPRTRKPGSVGLAAGPEVAVMDETGQLLPAGATGEIVIRGANVARGYENNPQANSAAFTEGWFRTGDQGHLDQEGYLFLTGRLKEMINRGGEKISPREIDEILLDHPAIAQALTFAMPHPTLGEEIAAVVVLAPGRSATEEEMRRFAATRLAHFKVPQRILFVEEIPKGPTGKLQRIGLAEKLGLTAAAIEEPASQDAVAMLPRTPEELEIAGVWKQVLGIESVGVHAPFLQLGGDSVLAVQVLSRMQDRLKVTIPLIDFFAVPTIAGLAELVIAQREKQTLEQETEENTVSIEALITQLENMSDADAERLLSQMEQEG